MPLLLLCCGMIVTAGCDPDVGAVAVMTEADNGLVVLFRTCSSDPTIRSVTLGISSGSVEKVVPLWQVTTDIPRRLERVRVGIAPSGWKEVMTLPTGTIPEDQRLVVVVESKISNRRRFQLRDLRPDRALTSEGYKDVREFLASC